MRDDHGGAVFDAAGRGAAVDAVNAEDALRRAGHEDELRALLGEDAGGEKGALDVQADEDGRLDALYRKERQLGLGGVEILRLKRREVDFVDAAVPGDERAVGGPAIRVNKRRGAGDDKFVAGYFGRVFGPDPIPDFGAEL